MAESVINSKDNQYVKLARALKNKKQRKEHSLFLAEGLANIREALNSQLEPCFLLCDVEKIDDERIAELCDVAKVKGAKVMSVAGRLFAAICDTEASQGLLLAVKTPKLTPQDFAKIANGRHIAVLDGLQDPGNVGTILRTAWAADLGGVLLTHNSADVFSPKVVRSAMGAVYHVPVLQLSADDTLNLLDDMGYHLTVADAGGEDFRSFKPKGAVAWLLGREACGPSPDFRLKAESVVAIPMAAGVDSLNVAIAAGILFFSQKA